MGSSVATDIIGTMNGAGLQAALHTGLHSAISSAVTSSINSAVIGVINSGGDLGKGLTQTFSGKGLENIAKSIAVAGFTSGLESGFDVKSANPGMAKGEYYMNLAKQSVVRSSVSGIVNGADLENIGRSAALSFGLGAAQNMVGDIGQKFNMEDGSAGKAAMHGAVGAAYADLSGGSTGVGFISGATAEIVSSYLSHPGTTTSHPGTPTSHSGLDPGSHQAEGILGDSGSKSGMTALTSSLAAFTSGGDVRDMEIASSIGASNIENNQGMHKTERIAVYKDALESAESEEERKAVTLAAMQELQAADGMPEGSTKEATKRYLESGEAEKGHALLGESEKRLGLEGVMKYSARDRFEDHISSRDEYLVRGAAGVLAGISFVDAAIGARLAKANPIVGYSMIAGGAYGGAIGGEAAFGTYIHAYLIFFLQK